MSEGTFDFSGLTVEADEMPTRSGTSAGRKSRYETNPLLPFVVESWNSGQGDPVKGGRSVTVPKIQIKDIAYLLRQAADSEGKGISIAVTLPDDKTRLKSEELDAMHNQKHLKVRFCTKEKRAYNPKRTETSAEEPSAE